MVSEDDKQATALKPWFVYILRCADDTFYTGVTTDISRRLDQHNGIIKNGAKYTRNRQPVTLVYQETSNSRSDACKREYAIKDLSRSEKERLIARK
ncbi:MAG: GIY-YIG nuclease family protein [Gammaproteobacteria bacterium]|nr:GIY-YIG nuclease family protein [Gammaproteobacteria bacterium]MBT8134488.1 GIY-YIG nuclease family protein [Gammaproteobacteria bacterium]NNJ49584.1 GIY-YIG nuclease family protein [Gammaproteobacteria bacterium]